MSEKRKVFLINPRFQLSLVAWFLLISALLISVFYFVNWYFFYNFAQEARSVGLPSDHVFFQFLNEQRSFMSKLFIIASIATLFLLGLGGIWISHKVAGPLYRLTKHLDQSSFDDVRPVTFRKGDYFKELQDAFNTFLERKK